MKTWEFIEQVDQLKSDVVAFIVRDDLHILYRGVGHEFGHTLAIISLKDEMTFQITKELYQPVAKSGGVRLVDRVRLVDMVLDLAFTPVAKRDILRYRVKMTGYDLHLVYNHLDHEYEWVPERIAKIPLRVRELTREQVNEAAKWNRTNIFESDAFQVSGREYGTLPEADPFSSFP